MASRRPPRDHLAHTGRNASEPDEDVPRWQHATPLFAKRTNVHPAATDFSLDTLGSYLYAKMEENSSKEQTLKLDPALAQIEAENERLRSLVNSSEPIIARIRGGRLEVYELRATTHLSRSFSSSEDDSDSHDEGVCDASGSRSTGTSFPDEPEHFKSFDRKQGSLRKPRRLTLQDSSVRTRVSSMLNQHQKDTNRTDLERYGSRARSFREHASGVRKSTRMHKSSKSLDSLTAEVDLSMDSDRARPRKLAISQTSPSPDLSTSATASDATDGPNDTVLFDDLDGAERALEAEESWSAAELRKDNSDDYVAGDDPDAGANTNLHANFGVARVFDPTTVPSKQRSNHKSFTGKDTFYSVSSDDAFISDQSEDAQTDIVSDDVTEEVDSLASNHAPVHAKCSVTKQFDYGRVIPEKVPLDINQAARNCRKIWALHGLSDEGEPDYEMSRSWHSSHLSIRELDPRFDNILAAQDENREFPREWTINKLPVSPHDPPVCPSNTQKCGFPQEILPMVCSYLSSQELRNLRLVNRATAAAILPLMIRNTVIEFGRPLFDSTDTTEWNSKSDHPALSSIIESGGEHINKFGVSFTWDPVGLANATPKVIEKEVQAWFGKYIWPKETYPRFQQLKELEDLVDSNRPLLKNTMKSLTRVHELALSVDSGHGWLNGPDVSDLALFRDPTVGGSKVFGKTFDAEDKLHEFAIRQYFKWGQINTLNAYAKRLALESSGCVAPRLRRNLIDRIQIRPYDDFLIQSQQPDFKRDAHTGGSAPPPDPLIQPALPAHMPPVIPAGAPAAGHVQAGGAPNMANHAVAQHMLFVPATPAGMLPSRRLRPGGRLALPEESGEPIFTQWPLIFSGHNIAAEVGGKLESVQREIARPAAFSYMPGELTESQVQWLMETLWAQRAFLSAYVNSIITNVQTFKNVHSLNIAKLSSGLIPSLAQDEFWASLPELRNLTLKISPDWRQEHTPGDKFYKRNMTVSPVMSSVKLADLLETHIVKLENLSVLRIGFIGGGEHQTGIFARNRFVLPAPITSYPEAWVTDHFRRPDPQTMLSFNHIRDLTFENCWFSPCMLKGFMQKSTDTSLHHLTLDSVSLTGTHDTRPEGPLTTETHRLRCEFSPSEWLHETIPSNACWVNVLESITPGKTILERKYDAEMIDETETPRPERSFRGNIQKITLNSCGYVRISGIQTSQFSQTGLVDQSDAWNAMDEGLDERRKLFYVTNSTIDTEDPEWEPFGPPRPYEFGASEKKTKHVIMMNIDNPEAPGKSFGLGKLTQCVHPVEKRVLERAWGMRFGWGDTMDRFAAVEDGWFEGGTGRFSGTVNRDD